MRYFFALAGISILLIGGVFHGITVASAQAQTETPTPTQTPDITPTPIGTTTPTETPTPSITPTPNLMAVSTLASGQAVAIQYTITAGEALNSLLLVILIGLVLFGLFLGMLKK